MIAKSFTIDKRKNDHIQQMPVFEEIIYGLQITEDSHTTMKTYIE